MDYKKISLYAALVVVALILWNAWQREYPPVANNTPTTQSQPTSSSSAVPTSNTNSASSTVPTVPSAHHVAKKITPSAAQGLYSGQFIHVKTDVLDIVIDTHGGNIEQAKLLKYPKTLDSKNSIELFNTGQDSLYVAQSGLTGPNGPDTQKGQAKYKASSLRYKLSSDENTVKVPLVWQGANGLKIIKTYVFHRDSYVIDMNYAVQNQGSKTWKGYVYTQLARKNVEHKGSLLTQYASFTGGAMSSPAEHYQKLKFKNFASEPINQNITGGWAAMIQQYFLSAWVPPANQLYHYYTRASADGVYTLGMIGPQLTVHSAQSISTDNKLYVGPAIASNLNALAPNLNMTIDYGWLFFISKIIFWVMSLIHSVIGNWGWSIILTTIVIKLLFFPLSDKSFKSMANMRKLQPKMATLKERHEGDRAGLSKATMELYRKEKVNPLSGCLPIVIQIPVFIALYWVIIQSVEFRLAPWMFWVKDLAVHDPYYILPVLMGVLMFVQQKMSPPPPDPTQAKVMMFMPVIFTVFFLHFPAGLVLYWITNTLFTIVHQFYVYKRVERDDKKQKLIKASKR